MLVEITGKRYEEKLITTSLKVAEKFEKNHQHILEAIDKLTVENSTVAEMFTLSTYKAGNNHEYRMYNMNRDGFSLLAMGFTGEKALRWKLDYIKAFNTMEAELKRIYTERQQWQIERDKGVIVRHILTDTIKMKVADSPHKKFAILYCSNKYFQTNQPVFVCVQAYTRLWRIRCNQKKKGKAQSRRTRQFSQEIFVVMQES